METVIVDQDQVDHHQLIKLNKAGPRYTSYPTAPEWETWAGAVATYREKLLELAASGRPLSLYFHIPFCESMCLFCGCSVILNRKEENEIRYIDYLIKEIDLVASCFSSPPKVVQLHFGGGTPTKLSEALFLRLYEKLQTVFEIDPTGELSIEIDPRTVVQDSGSKLRMLRRLGFNRVSFGVQDTDPKVQEAVKRRQTYEMTRETYELARSLGFTGISFDLIYGLPYQTVTSFQDTLTKIIGLRPDRVALFSYAKIPWLKPHQKAIDEVTLPSTEEKFKIYVQARKAFLENGYVAIGMDHFALQEDGLAKAYLTKRLQRNFQGYSLKLAEDVVSMGVTSIGFVQEAYFQNLKELSEYYKALDAGALPVFRGKVLNLDDKIRKWVIHTLMCDFELDKKVFKKQWNLDFDQYFAGDQRALEICISDGLVNNSPEKLLPTPYGKLFIRNIAMVFDAYLKKQETQGMFSQAI